MPNGPGSCAPPGAKVHYTGPFRNVPEPQPFTQISLPESFVDLYLICHAEAVPLGPDGPSNDFDRPLTEAGRSQAGRLATTFEAKGVRVGRLVSSPLVRARQTAEVLAQVWHVADDSLLTCEDLAPEGKFRNIAQFIKERRAESIGLVGHEPDMGELAGWLIGSRKAGIKFAKGGVALIQIKDGEAVGKGAGQLLWMLPPLWT